MGNYLRLHFFFSSSSFHSIISFLKVIWNKMKKIFNWKLWQWKLPTIGVQSINVSGAAQKFPLRIFSVNAPNALFPADLVTFLEEILNRKLHFLCSVFSSILTHLFRFNKQHLKTSENLEFLWYFQWVYQRNIDLKWVTSEYT